MVELGIRQYYSYISCRLLCQYLALTLIAQPPVFSAGSSQPYHRALQVSPTVEPYKRQPNRRVLQLQERILQEALPTADASWSVAAHQGLQYYVLASILCWLFCILAAGENNILCKTQNWSDNSVAFNVLFLEYWNKLFVKNPIISIVSSVFSHIAGANAKVGHSNGLGYRQTWAVATGCLFTRNLFQP